VKNQKLEFIGDPEADRFWIMIDKRSGDWVYTLRTKLVYGSALGAEVARFNSFSTASAGGENFLRWILKALNREEP